MSRFTVMAEALGSEASSAASPLWNVLTDAGAHLLFGSNWPAARSIRATHARPQ